MKLALGTAQFGMAYGIASPQPQISYAESAAILEYGRCHGMSLLDTAIGYGDSETRLGQIGVAEINVVTKLPEVPECESITKWVVDSVKKSLGCLKIDSLYGLLLHRPEQLLGSKGAEIYSALHSLKTDGLVKKIGVSIYQPEELKAIFSKGHFDIVQSPLSIIDRRLINSGWLDRLSDRDVEVHARSVFLQGLLLMTASGRPEKFEHLSGLWASYDQWVDDSGRSQLEVCLGYAMSIPGIQRVVVGVNSLNHIKEIIAATAIACPEPPLDLYTEDPFLLNPLAWL
jgi:aryl-alcohol dehydrogenase-like predicted oxidoreductase